MEARTFKRFTGVSVVVMTTFIVAVIGMLAIQTTPNALATNLQSEEILFSIRLSLLTATASSIMSMIVGVPTGYALARAEFPGKSFAETVVNVPLALPPLVAGVGLLLFFGHTPVGDLLNRFGIEFVFTKSGIVMAQFLINVPFAIRIMRSTFDGINPRYEHVAKTLGYTHSETFRKVTLPMAKNGFLASTAITWAKGMGEFGAVLMLAGATHMKTETLPIAVFLNMSSGEIELAIAAAIILVIVSFVALFVLERFGGDATIY